MSTVPFSIRVKVTFRDIDALGHVNNAVYFTYMESARAEYWIQLFDCKDLHQLGFIVAHAECDYKIAARYGDELDVSIRTSSVGTSSFVWDYEIRKVQSGDLVALGKTIQVYYDYKNEQKLPVPEEVRRKLLGDFAPLR
jgi:acyl-CoA thioester hydrolase